MMKNIFPHENDCRMIVSVLKLMNSSILGHIPSFIFSFSRW